MINAITNAFNNLFFTVYSFVPEKTSFKSETQTWLIFFAIPILVFPTSEQLLK